MSSRLSHTLASVEESRSPSAVLAASRAVVRGGCPRRWPCSPPPTQQTRVGVEEKGALRSGKRGHSIVVRSDLAGHGGADEASLGFFMRTVVSARFRILAGNHQDLVGQDDAAGIVLGEDGDGHATRQKKQKQQRE